MLIISANEMLLTMHDTGKILFNISNNSTKEWLINLSSIVLTPGIRVDHKILK